MPLAAPASSIEVEQPDDFETAMSFVRSVALNYVSQPLLEPSDSIVLSDGSTLRVNFVTHYFRSAGSCFSADGQLAVGDDVRDMLSGSREIYLNIAGAEQMIRISRVPAPGTSHVRSTRDRVRSLNH